MLLQELINQVGSKGLEGALHANKYMVLNELLNAMVDELPAPKKKK